MAARGLDIVEQQIAAYYPEDAEIGWHHRILVRRLNDQGRWVAASPDLELEVMDLNQTRFLPLTRSAAIPARIRDDFYGFGNAGVTEQQLSDLHVEAEALAQVLGGACQHGRDGPCGVGVCRPGGRALRAASGAGPPAEPRCLAPARGLL